MSNLSNIVALAKEIGLEGEELKQFVLQKESEKREELLRKESDEREARAQAREDRRLELEAEKSRQEFELRKLELEAQRASSSGSKQLIETTRRPAFPTKTTCV